MAGEIHPATEGEALPDFIGTSLSDVKPSTEGYDAKKDALIFTLRNALALAEKGSIGDRSTRVAIKGSLSTALELINEEGGDRPPYIPRSKSYCGKVHYGQKKCRDHTHTIHDSIEGRCGNYHCDSDEWCPWRDSCKKLSPAARKQFHKAVKKRDERTTTSTSQKKGRGSREGRDSHKSDARPDPHGHDRGGREDKKSVFSFDTQPVYCMKGHPHQQLCNKTKDPEHIRSGECSYHHEREKCPDGLACINVPPSLKRHYAQMRDQLSSMTGECDTSRCAERPRERSRSRERETRELLCDEKLE